MDGKRSTRKIAPHMEIGVGNCDKIAITTQVGNYYFEEKEADSEEMKKENDYALEDYEPENDNVEIEYWREERGIESLD